MRIEELVPADESRWDAFVAQHPASSHYHRTGWRKVIRSAFGHPSFYRVAWRGAEIAGVLPIIRFSNPLFGRYLVSMPYLNRGGILADSPEASRALLEDAQRLVVATHSKYCELRHAVPLDPSLPRREGKVSMSIDISTGTDVLWESIGPKVRNLVRKAEKSGLVVHEGTSPRQVDAFYDVFAENMRDLGTPVYTARFFREIVKMFPDSIRLSIVEAGRKVAAAGMCVIHNGVAEMHWAASRRAMRAQSPNMLLYWEAIAHFSRQGLHSFCFGRSSEDSGPYRFKKQWGATPQPLAWEYSLAPGEQLPRLNPDNPKYRAAVGAWKHLPLGVARILGPPIVRHIP
jgi:FemAB-related protein (PEP-CTERM system-associated)